MTFKPPPEVNESDVNQVLRARSKSVKDRKEGRRSVDWAQATQPPNGSSA